MYVIKYISYRWLKRIFTIAIFVCLLFILFVISRIIFLFNSSYLSFVLRGLSSTSKTTSPSTFITWEIPDFAYYNNQLLLHFGTIAYMPLGTHFLSPDFRFPAVRQTNTTYTPIHELYDRDRLREIHLYDRQTLEEKSFQIRRTPWVHVALEWLSLDTGLNQTIINITNEQDGIRTEDLWKIIFTRLILRVFFFNQKTDITRVAHAFQYINNVQSCVSSTLANYPNLTRALGIHLRTWAADLSIGSISSRECISIHKNNPLNYFFKCQILTNEDLKIIRSSIERVQNSPYQPIYFVTDNHQSTLVIELKRFYADRLIEIDEECHREKRLTALIENELLTRTHSFLGSFFSTFSLVVAIKREVHRTYFIQTIGQYILYHYIILIIIGCLLIILIILVLLRILCKRIIRVNRTLKFLSV